MNQQVQIVSKFLLLKERAKAIGITLKINSGFQPMYFEFPDVPKASGIIPFDTIEEVEIFIYGYEQACKAGLLNGK